MQQPTNQSVGQRKDIPGHYLDIALVAEQYKIYCPVMAFDLRTQSVTYVCICVCMCGCRSTPKANNDYTNVAITQLNKCHNFPYSL